jgi:hypothetical protein
MKEKEMRETSPDGAIFETDGYLRGSRSEPLRIVLLSV